jgi:hypothetical protein
MKVYCLNLPLAVIGVFRIKRKTAVGHRDRGSPLPGCLGVGNVDKQALLAANGIVQLCSYRMSERRQLKVDPPIAFRVRRMFTTPSSDSRRSNIGSRIGFPNIRNLKRQIKVPPECHTASRIPASSAWYGCVGVKWLCARPGRLGAVVAGARPLTGAACVIHLQSQTSAGQGTRPNPGHV